MFCTKCGNELAEGSAFCSNCGNPVNQSPALAANSAAFAGAASSAAPAGVYDANQSAFMGVAVPHGASAGAAAAKKKPILPITIAVIVTAVIGVAIFTGGFGLLDDSRSNESIEESNTGTEVDGGEEEAEDTETNENSVEVKDAVEEYTWEELSVISAEISTASDEDAAIEIAKKYNLVNEDGTLDGTQTKSVTLSDGTVTSVQIAGFVHDDKSDGSGKAGITFIFTDAISTMHMNSNHYNTGGWESSDMRGWLASDGKALLPEELQDVLVTVDKYTNNVGYVWATDDTSSVATTTSDELWLFSYVELAGESGESEFDEGGYEYLAAIYNSEGSQYKLFSDCNVDPYDTNDILTKTYQGELCWWWERSPHPANFRLFLFVYTGSNLYSSNNADSSWAVVPGFCI